MVQRIRLRSSDFFAVGSMLACALVLLCAAGCSGLEGGLQGLQEQMILK